MGRVFLVFAAMKWHAGRVLLALADHLQWDQTRCLPEFEIDGGKADLVQISRAGYLTEFEIKVTLADWNADRTKAKFAGHRPHVARFFYVIPDNLVDRIPDWVPASAGILVVSPNDGSWRDRVREHRPARRAKGCLTVPPDTAQRLLEACYFRFWRHHTGVQHKRRKDLWLAR